MFITSNTVKLQDICFCFDHLRNITKLNIPFKREEDDHSCSYSVLLRLLRLCLIESAGHLLIVYKWSGYCKVSYQVFHKSKRRFKPSKWQRHTSQMISAQKIADTFAIPHLDILALASHQILKSIQNPRYHFRVYGLSLFSHF